MKASIHWFAHNPVAANLFMLSVFILGALAIPETRMELIPNVSLERISIQSTLNGASVETVESNLCKPLENRIYDIPGTLDLTSTSFEGLCSITLDVEDGYQTQDILDEVNNRIQGYDSLPDDASIPIVKELNVRNRVAKLIVSSKSDYSDLTKIARSIRSELLEYDNISIIDLEDIKDSEIEISIPSHNLEKYNLTFEKVNLLIRQQTGQLPGGMLKTLEGDVLITAQADRDNSEAYRNIVISSNEAGSEITLRDIAIITDNRHSQQSQASFDHEQAVSMDIYRIGNQNIIDIADTLNQYIKNKKISDNINLYIWQDDSKHFKSRIDLLLDNAFSGLLLLFIILLLFLNARLSFWVSLGIPISFFGCLFLLPIFDVSINIISLFAFILVLGIVVDDAVVVGESIHQQNQLGFYGIDGALKGTYQVYKPIFFAIATSVVAFLPLLFLPGPEGKLMQAIPIVVISTLIFSLLESMYILPSHLSGNKPSNTDKKISNNKLSIVLKSIQESFSRFLNKFINNVYQPLLIKALKHKIAVILGFSMVAVLFIILLSTGWMRIALFSAIEADVITATVSFPEGSSRIKTENAVNRLKIAAQELNIETSKTEQQQTISHVYAVIGPKNKISNQDLDQERDHTAQVTLELGNSENRDVSGQFLLNRWRTLTGTITDVEDLTFSASLNPAQPDINIEFSGDDLDLLRDAADELKKQLLQYEGIYDVRDSLNSTKQQAHIELKDNAIALGMTLEDVVKQVNYAYQGEVVRNIQTQDDEIEVWLGLPEEERASMWHLENLPIYINNDEFIPLSNIANIQYRAGKNNIKRYEKKRIISISAFVNPKLNSVFKIQKDLTENQLDQIVSNYTGIKWSTTGQQKSIARFLQILMKGYLIAILVMYLMMAILFSSYSQPFLVLFAIPFGLLGSIIGHLILNLELTLWSFIGMVAVSGVVVNDNLVLMDFINQQRKNGIPVFNAVCAAGKKRFRPILLTSLTTFAGLTPLILEDSIQAQFLIPMAVSLAFGVLFATLISLLLVPASYLLLDEWHNRLNNWRNPAIKHISKFNFSELAYYRGHQQGRKSEHMHPNASDIPYKKDELISSWKKGWEDAKGKQNTE